MHTKKFIQRLKAMATSPEAIDGIVDEIAQGLVTNRLTTKDLHSLVKELREDTATKPILSASKKNLLPDSEEFDQEELDTLGMQVKDGDMMYKRTFDGDVNKLLD